MEDVSPMEFSGFMLLYSTVLGLMSFLLSSLFFDLLISAIFGLSAFFGLSLHSLVTGIALGTSVMVPELGLIVFLAIILHKLPASLSLTSLFLKEGYPNKKLFFYLTTFSLMVPIGALITFLFLQHTSIKTIGALTAFSAGTFLHVASDDLLPEVHQHSHDRYSRLIAFFIGLCSIWIVTFLE